MNDVIRLLPDSVANQIAAGEVIQRPASVVKELVENAIDAGATVVQIVVKDAGRTLIQVIDNGCGMSATDARMAFERHATSKIRQATDLYSLHTMGFRGEALPSIAAVSEVEVRTMRPDDVAGTRLCISASKVESQQPDVCATGTNIMVKRLFFNLPARRKFLKKDPVEMGHIMREFERLALVNTGVEFAITHNDVLLHKLHPAPLKQRIADLFGKGLEHQLLPVQTQTPMVKIDGFVCQPQHARRRGALQYFFVNGRNMRHPYFHKAVMACYDRLIQPDAQPLYFINFTVDPESIDVNIHPQKHEIKFENEQLIFQILGAAVREALGRWGAGGALDFDSVDIPDIPVYNPSSTAEMPPEDGDPAYNPFLEQDPAPGSRPAQGGSPARSPMPGQHTSAVPTDWQKLYDSFTARGGDDGMPTVCGSRLNSMPPAPPASPGQSEGCSAPAPEVQSLPLTAAPTHSSPVMMQLRGRYIITPARSGLMVIDQHRAHTLILYERYLAMMHKGEIPSQRLIFPESVTLDPAGQVVATSIDGLLATMGFEISHLGDNTWAINAVPSLLGDAGVVDAFMRIIAAVSDETDDVEQAQWQRIALSMASSAAVKYGATLTTEEMDHIISQLLQLPTPNYTPDGKTVIAVIDMDSISALF